MEGGIAAVCSDFKHAATAQELYDLSERNKVGKRASAAIGTVFDADLDLVNAGENFL